MRADEADVAIVLVNWNGWRDTIDAVRGCLALAPCPARIRIIVCDNGSTDGSLNRIAGWAAGEDDYPISPDWPLAIDLAVRPAALVRLTPTEAETAPAAPAPDRALVLIDNVANLGFAGGNNVGMRWALAAGCTHAWLLNNDAVPQADALDALLAHAPPGEPILAGSVLLDPVIPPRVQALAGALDLRGFQTRHLCAGRDLEALPPADRIAELIGADEAIYPVGASMLATRAFLEKVGLLTEDYFLFYEEPDWALRAADAGARVVIVPESRVFHRQGASTGRSTRAISLYLRSRLLAAAHHAPKRRGEVARAIAWGGIKSLLRGRGADARAAWLALTGRVVMPEGLHNPNAPRRTEKPVR